MCPGSDRYLNHSRKPHLIHPSLAARSAIGSAGGIPDLEFSSIRGIVPASKFQPLRSLIQPHLSIHSASGPLEEDRNGQSSSIRGTAFGFRLHQLPSLIRPHSFMYSVIGPIEKGHSGTNHSPAGTALASNFRLRQSLIRQSCHGLRHSRPGLGRSSNIAGKTRRGPKRPSSLLQLQNRRSGVSCQMGKRDVLGMTEEHQKGTKPMRSTNQSARTCKTYWPKRIRQLSLPKLHGMAMQMRYLNPSKPLGLWPRPKQTFSIGYRPSNGKSWPTKRNAQGSSRPNEKRS